MRGNVSGPPTSCVGLLCAGALAGAFEGAFAGAFAGLLSCAAAGIAINRNARKSPGRINIISQDQCFLQLGSPTFLSKVNTNNPLLTDNFRIPMCTAREVRVILLGFAGVFAIIRGRGRVKSKGRVESLGLCCRLCHAVNGSRC